MNTKTKKLRQTKIDIKTFWNGSIMFQIDNQSEATVARLLDISKGYLRGCDGNIYEGEVERVVEYLNAKEAEYHSVWTKTGSYDIDEREGIVNFCIIRALIHEGFYKSDNMTGSTFLKKY